MSVVRNCARVLLVLAAMACWAQSQSAQVVDDRLQAPEGPSSVHKAGGMSRSHDSSGAQSRQERESRRAHKSKTHSGVSHPPAALVEEPKPEPPPPPPPTLAQLPPNAPQVSYRNGLLTVTANNSTLGDIMSLVRSKTGASIEYPPALSQERVAAVVGPAPAPQVLAALLNGTRFDYILLGMNGRPDLLQRAIITPRASSGAMAAAATPPAQTRPAPAAAEEEPDTAPEETVEQPEEAPQPQPQPVQVPPGLQTVPNQPFPQQQGDQQQPQQPKTPEQLLQELQRLQQQQQQQQQQQPPQQ